MTQGRNPAEAARFFAMRAARGTPEGALAVLDRLGSAEMLREDDRIDDGQREPPPHPRRQTVTLLMNARSAGPSGTRPAGVNRVARSWAV
ncbi:MAG: hypothetical protein RLY86_3924 [Pseudomonadota bacterium]